MQRISPIIKSLLDENQIAIKDMADILGCQTASLRNKLSQDRFTIDELIMIAESCGYTLKLVPTKGGDSIPITSDYISDSKKQAVKDFKSNRLHNQFEVLKKYLDVPGIDAKEKEELIKNLIDKH